MNKRLDHVRDRANAKFPSWSDARYLLDLVDRQRTTLERLIDDVEFRLPRHQWPAGTGEIDSGIRLSGEVVKNLRGDLERARSALHAEGGNDGQ